MKNSEQLNKGIFRAVKGSIKKKKQPDFPLRKNHKKKATTIVGSFLLKHVKFSLPVHQAFWIGIYLPSERYVKA